MGSSSDKPMNCRVFKRSLYHFQSDELTAAERSAFEEHLHACPPCAARLEVEEGLLRGLKARLAPASAPPGLETRIREQMRQASRERSPGVHWIRRPWFAAMAASVLLALLLVPGSNLFQTTSAITRVIEVVTVVDHQCDLAGLTHEQQRLCTKSDHLNALRRDDGTYWHVSVDDRTGRDMSTAAALRGRRMRVEGVLYESIRTLQVERAEEAAPRSASLVFSGL